MKIFLAYKFTDSDKTALKNLIETISIKLQNFGHSTFCFYRDIQNWGDININRADIMPKALKNLDGCDAVLVIIDEKTKSIGVGIEIGYAKAKNKKVFLAKRSGIETDYIDSIADNIYIYGSMEDLQENLKVLIA